MFSRSRKQFANHKIPPNKTEGVKSWNVPTLRGAVVFVSLNPGEPDALLGLVREDQLGWRVGSLCEHNQRQLTASNTPQAFSGFASCQEQMMDGQIWCRRTSFWLTSHRGENSPENETIGKLEWINVNIL